MPVKLLNPALLPPDAVEVAKVEGIPIYKGASAVAWESNLAIDADGDPQAYHPSDWGPLRGRAPLGLDAPENAGAYRGADGRPLASWALVKEWWGIAVGPGGVPIIQTETDPAPGFFVSTTALVDPSVTRVSPARYASSREIPYIAVPPEVLNLGVRVGDLVHVTAGGVTVSAVVGDVGPRRKIGEGSIALVRALGLELPARMARILGVPAGGRSRSGGVFFKVFIHSGTGRLLSAAEIQERGAAYV